MIVKDAEMPVREAIKRKSEKSGLLANNIKHFRTIIISELSQIPSKQLQKMRKVLKDIKIIVVKKAVLSRAIESIKQKEQELSKIEKLKEYCDKPFAVLFSQHDPFEVAAILSKNTIPTRAKANQTADKDIVLHEGTTDIPAGPMITMFGNAGIKVGVDKGKISIKETKLIIKKGGKITQDIAEVLSRMDISPVSIGLKVKAAYDKDAKGIYFNIVVSKEETINKIKTAGMHALNLALHINYICKRTINMLMAKAYSQAKTLSNFIGLDDKVKTESKTENIKPDDVKKSVPDNPAENKDNQ